MSRSHVLLHCSDERLRAARVEAWEGKEPGGVRALLANPRWERRFLTFLERSRVGRVVADEDGTHAAAMDEWIVWEAKERVALGANLIAFSFFSLHLFCKGDSCPGTCAQRDAEGGGFIM
jgi:hypothetical protein